MLSVSLSLHLPTSNIVKASTSSSYKLCIWKNTIEPFNIHWLLLPPKLPKSNLTTATTHHLSKPYHTLSKSGSPSLPYSLTETVSSQLLFFASIVYHFHRIADLMLPPPPSVVSNDRPLPRHRYKHKHTYSLNKKIHQPLTSHQNLQTFWSEAIVRHHTLSHRPSQSRFIVSHHSIPPYLSIFFPLSLF